ncbi:SDR family NAD(P)-dependent oxidoreductase [Nocardioides campestrisoli]|uniref:SDR family NAD(P)-dependent oxidoreductase n=1 Tax=Nocardioides campestrisoli TaxID=2736757 RepID=UPI00163D4B4E|nr:SDR family oxidoreductase [Nocardioides campestrisoli]
MFSLQGKKALVTGGGSGIGLAMAQGLAGAGAEVTLWGRNTARLETARDSFGDGAQVHVDAVDVGDPDAVRRGVETVVERMGDLDTVVVSAGTGGAIAPITEVADDEHRRVLTTNVDGVMWTIRETAKVMVERAKAGRPGGSIITIASLAAIEGAGRNSSYGASKGAVVALSNAAAVELARYGIRVNTILPGWIATEMSQPQQDSELFDKHVISRVPLGRWGRPEEFGGAAVYLASDASSFQTGSQLVIDGGYSIF